MSSISGKCAVIVDNQKLGACHFAVELVGGPQAYGFLSGPLEILKSARGRLQLELEDGSRVYFTVLQVSDAGMALIIVDVAGLRLSS
jgi:hypothetical protein